MWLQKRRSLLVVTALVAGWPAGCLQMDPPDYGLDAMTLTFPATDSAQQSEYFLLDPEATATVRLVSLTDATGQALTARVTAALVNQEGATLSVTGLSGLNVLGGQVLPPTVLLAGFSLRTDTPFTFEFNQLTEWGVASGEGRVQLRVFLLPWELIGTTAPIQAVVEVR